MSNHSCAADRGEASGCTCNELMIILSQTIGTFYFRSMQAMILCTRHCTSKSMNDRSPLAKQCLVQNILSLVSNGYILKIVEILSTIFVIVA